MSLTGRVWCLLDLVRWKTFVALLLWEREKKKEEINGNVIYYHISSNLVCVCVCVCVCGGGGGCLAISNTCA